MKKYYAYPAIFDDTDNKPGLYTVTVPDVEGVVTDGEGIATAMMRAKECLEGVLLLSEDGFPAASSLEDVQKDNPGKIVNYVTADMDEAKRISESPMVNKNTRIPLRLVEKGKKAKVNFSQLLTDALEEKLEHVE